MLYSIWEPCVHKSGIEISANKMWNLAAERPEGEYPEACRDIQEHLDLATQPEEEGFSGPEAKREEEEAGAGESSDIIIKFVILGSSSGAHCVGWRGSP